MAISASKAYLYNDFIYALGTNKISAADYKNIKFYITDSLFYDVNRPSYFNKVNTFNILDVKNKYGDLEPYKCVTANMIVVTGSNGETKTTPLSSKIYLTRHFMSAYNIDTFNKDTGLKSENCYEKITNNPCSSKIFYEQTNSWVRDDLDFPEQPVNPTDPIFKYFAAAYNFNTAFNKTEYQSYNVDMTPVVEDVTRLSSFQLNLKANQAMTYGAAGILLTYPTIDKEIPMAYYNFGKVYYSTNNTLQLDWHEDGIVKVE